MRQALEHVGLEVERLETGGRGERRLGLLTPRLALRPTATVAAFAARSTATPSRSPTSLAAALTVLTARPATILIGAGVFAARLAGFATSVASATVRRMVTTRSVGRFSGLLGPGAIVLARLVRSRLA